MSSMYSGLTRVDTAAPHTGLAEDSVVSLFDEEMPLISLVVPVFNEAESLARLHEEIAQMARAAQLEVEIVFVDDGSRDDSWLVISDLAQRDSRINAIRFRRNFGKAAALDAGFAAARGDFVITLDADLQDDPAQVPQFLDMLDGGLDVVSGWKRKRHDPWHKVGPSRVFNKLVSGLTGVHLHDHNCGMKAYRAEVVRELRLYGERHRFIPVLAAARGFRIGEMEVAHRAREFGYSKYGISRFLKGFLDLLTVKFLTHFGNRPQHVLGGAGLALFLLGGLGLGYLGLTWFWRLFDAGAYLPLSDRPLLTYATAAMLLGAQMLSMGILAEMVIERRGKAEDGYAVTDTLQGMKPERGLALAAVGSANDAADPRGRRAGQS
jgi:glycosyltransferase involved in cell wall biosynthesis